MNRSESGFTFIELVVGLGLVVMITLAGTVISFHSFRAAAKTTDHVTAISNPENAGHWISRDACMADDVVAENLTSPAFLILKWTDWGYGTPNVYYTVTYSIENITDGVGQLKRRYQNNQGVNQQILIADYIYYNTSDPANTTAVTYQSPNLNLKVATRLGSSNEVRQYQIFRRPNF